MQIRKLAGPVCIAGLCSLSLTLMSFTDNGKLKNKSLKSEKDSLASKDVKSLFGNTVTTPLVTDLAISVPLNANAVSFVTAYLKRESEEFNSMKSWGKPYFDIFDRILTANNIPVQLKYLAVIESTLQANLCSSAGAVGPWQLMSYEGKRYGLKMGANDERKNFTKSTQAAAKLINTLYSTFGDWLLVIAAYNAGEGRVREAIKKAGSRSFWDLQNYLPLETRNHVKKFIATHYYFEGTGGITTMTADETAKFIQQPVNATASDTEFANTVTVEIEGRYNSTVMAKYLQVDKALLSKLNPRLDEALSQGTVYNLRLPAEKASVFEQNRKQILKESVQLLMETSSAVK